MDDPIKWYGGAGWSIASVLALGVAVVAVEPLAAQALLALLAVGTLGLGVRALWEGTTPS